jgi:DNA-binding response OmpR family regulator
MSSLSSNQATILVIDSVTENIELLTEDLEDDGYLVLSSTKGLEGITIAQLQQPDVILIDVKTEDINGFRACQLLKDNKHTSDIPVFLLSSREDIDDVIKGLDLGASDYISKPFHYKVLAARIRSVLRLKKS